ncbi:uncharacterized protein LOC134285210 [Aedes albopictus]|uniref:Secreted protein n=1 Tax=Aedes albopictus TaxID=7160 RepID=A0ABM1YA11_AEDAL
MLRNSGPEIGSYRQEDNSLGSKCIVQFSRMRRQSSKLIGSPRKACHKSNRAKKDKTIEAASATIIEHAVLDDIPEEDLKEETSICLKSWSRSNADVIWQGQGNDVSRVMMRGRTMIQPLKKKSAEKRKWVDLSRVNR